MILSLWLRQLHCRLFGRESRSSGRKRPPTAVRQRFRPCLEPLEDRLAPSADLVQAVANPASASYNESTQTAQLTAQVKDTTNSSTTVNEGTVKFTVVNSSNQTVGTAATGTVTANGTAQVSYGLPANLLVGSYTIDVSYSDSTDDNFTDGNNDQSAALTITPAATDAATTTTATNATASLSTIAQHVTLNASVTSSGGPVNEGAVRFLVLNDSSGQTIGTTASGNVTSNGSASVSYGLPAFLLAGSYTIEADYSDPSGSFADSTDKSHTLTITAASTTTTASSTTASFSTSPQNVTLNATVTSNGNAVNEGKVQFTLVNSTDQTIGTALSGSVTSKGNASVSYGLPAYTLVGSYTIEADYSDNSGNFAASSDDSQTLTVSAASTTTTASSTTTTFSASDQNVTLNASVTSSGGTVNEGSVSFLLFDSNGNTVGSSVSGSVSNGAASVSYVVPAGTPTGSYSIETDYTDGSGSFAASSDNTHTLTVSSVAPSWGLTTVAIVPNLSNRTAQVTMTADVSNSAGTINEGVLSFTLAGVTKEGNVVNGSASVQLTLPLQSVMTTSVVTLSFSDPGSTGYTNTTNTMTLAVNVWSAMLPTNLTFTADDTERFAVLMSGQSLFGYTYSASGLLTQINISSLSLPVTYSNVTGGEMASIAGAPWQITFVNSDSQVQGILTLALNGDGSTQWLLYDSNGHLIGALPS